MQRLQAPDFVALERHFGHSLPEALRALYNDKQELMRGDFDVAASAEVAEGERWYVGCYQPADEQSVRDDCYPGMEEYFAFANDGCGNDYLVDPKQDDPPVQFLDYETGELLHVCDRLTEFMKWPRLELPR